MKKYLWAVWAAALMEMTISDSTTLVLSQMGWLGSVTATLKLTLAFSPKPSVAVMVTSVTPSERE